MAGEVDGVVAAVAVAGVANVTPVGHRHIGVPAVPRRPVEHPAQGAKVQRGAGGRLHVVQDPHLRSAHPQSGLCRGKRWKEEVQVG